MNDLEEIVTPEPMLIKVTGNTSPIAIRPVRAGRFPAFIRAMKPLLAAWNGAMTADGDVDWLKFVCEAGDDLIPMLVVATNLRPDQVGELYIDDLIELTSAVIRLNADFFLKRALPALQKAMTAFPIASAGQTSSGV